MGGGGLEGQLRGCLAACSSAGRGAQQLCGALATAPSPAPILHHPPPLSLATQVLRDKPWPALARTGSQMAQYGGTLALVGGTFAAVDVRSACLRGAAAVCSVLAAACCLLLLCLPATLLPATPALRHPSASPPPPPQCFVESARGKKDWMNGSLAGAAAGMALGLRSESRLPAAFCLLPSQGTPPALAVAAGVCGQANARSSAPPPAPLACLAVGSLPAAVKAAAALAFVSAMVDMSGGRLVGTGMVDDGATPPRRIYPYTS